MKKIILFITFFIALISYGQHSGNFNINNTNIGNTVSETNYPSSFDIYANIKVMANVKADSYMAIFSTSQIGKTAEETNQLIDARINSCISNFSKDSIYIDMVSFVPKYEYETDKKIFSKRTYKEIPVGFEIKKNIHITYKNPKTFNQIVQQMSKFEIYDLVKVNYLSSKIGTVKNQMMEKASELLQKKIINYQNIISEDLTKVRKKILDKYTIINPNNQYNSYTAFNSQELNINKKSVVSNTNKTTTSYYQPILNTDFDFVINPTINEPCIQVIYDLKLIVDRKKTEKKSPKKYFIITPNGELKDVKL